MPNSKVLKFTLPKSTFFIVNLHLDHTPFSIYSYIVKQKHVSSRNIKKSEQTTQDKTMNRFQDLPVTMGSEVAEVVPALSVIEWVEEILTAILETDCTGALHKSELIPSVGLIVVESDAEWVEVAVGDSYDS